MENRHVLNNSKKIVPILIIVLAAAMRLVPHIPNVAPITGLALFSGAHFGKKTRFILPLAAMLVSDLFLGFHTDMPFVYAGFFLITIIGSFLNEKTQIGTLLLATLSSSLLFYLITNFGVWMSTDMYTKDLNGLLNSYLMGLPFLRNTILGDAFYTFAFFYGFRYYNYFVQNTSKRITH